MFRPKRTPGTSRGTEGSISKKRTNGPGDDTRRTVSFAPIVTGNTSAADQSKPRSFKAQASANPQRHSILSNRVKTAGPNLQRRESPSTNINISNRTPLSFDINNNLIPTLPSSLHCCEDEKISVEEQLPIAQNPGVDFEMQTEIPKIHARDKQETPDILSRDTFLAPLEIYQSFGNEDRKLNVVWTPSMKMPTNDSDVSWKSCVSNASSSQVASINTKFTKDLVLAAVTTGKALNLKQCQIISGTNIDQFVSEQASRKKLSLLNPQNEDTTGLPIPTLSDILPGLKENTAEKKSSNTKKKIIKLSRNWEDGGVPIVTLSELGFGASQLKGDDIVGEDQLSILELIAQWKDTSKDQSSDSANDILSLTREEDAGVRLVTLDDLISGGGSPINEYIRQNGTNWVDTREKLIIKRINPGFWARIGSWFKAPNVFKIHQINYSVPLLNVSRIQNPFRHYFDGLDNMYFKVKPILQANSSGCWIIECTDTTCKYTEANGNEIVLRNANVHFADGKYILGPLTYFTNCHALDVSLLMENYATDETFVARKNRNTRNASRSPADFQIVQLNNMNVNSEDKYFGSVVATVSRTSGFHDKFCLSFVKPLSALNKTLLTSGSLLIVHDFGQNPTRTKLATEN